VPAVETKGRTEAIIGQLLDKWIAAVQAKDLDRLMTLYARDVIVYDYPPPLQHVGVDAHRRAFEDWFAMMPGAVKCEFKDVHIRAGEKGGVAHFLNHVTYRDADGKSQENWVRVTTCFEDRQGEWKVVHEHVSVPIDQQGKGMMNLKP
jgi:uncharacterized protein (TIGR02246 family)